MTIINKNYLYTESNEWIEVKDNIARIGINDDSQDEFGEIVYVDLPKINQIYSKGDAVCVIESVKTASDIYSPLSGQIVKVNEKLINDPNLINKSCYKNGWIFEIKIYDNKELNTYIKK